MRLGAMSLEELKSQVREIGKKYADRQQRVRRLFIEEGATSLQNERDREFSIKSEISKFFRIPYSSVSFCGSAQLGFSIHQDKLFSPANSDLDVACIDAGLYQKAWINVVTVTRAFSDLTPFGQRGSDKIEALKEQILRRGMIVVDFMPKSDLSIQWSTFQNGISKKHTSMFRRITIAIYMNEYAFCWKQDATLSNLLG